MHPFQKHRHCFRACVVVTGDVHLCGTKISVGIPSSLFNARVLEHEHPYPHAPHMYKTVHAYLMPRVFTAFQNALMEQQVD